MRHHDWKFDFGEKYDAKHDEVERKKSSINWETIRKERLKRIQWEIDQGLNPVEAFEVDATKPKPKPNHRIGIGGSERTYDHDEIIRLYTEENWTGTNIAKKIGANPTTVYGILKRAGVTREYNGGHNAHTESAASQP